MKKFLSLVLALVMTMSLVTVSAGAADFKDSKSIEYVEAVEVLDLIGVLEGYPDGSFQPKTVLTRAQAATIIAKLILTPELATELSVEAAPFADVPATHWAAAYIAEGVEQGILAGMGDGTFAPDAQLTGFQFLKMLFVALGYDAVAEGLTGANYTMGVTKLNKELKLTEGNDKFVGKNPVTREEAALYVWNAMNTEQVDYDNGNGGMTIKVENVVIETNGSADADGNGEFWVNEYKLAKYDGEKAEDDFGRAGYFWFIDENAKGYDKKDEKTCTISEAATYVLVAEKAYKATEMDKLLEDNDIEDIDAIDFDGAIAVGTVVELWVEDEAVETVLTYTYEVDFVAEVTEADEDDESDDYEHGISTYYTLVERDETYVDAFECDDDDCTFCEDLIAIGEWEEDDAILFTVNEDGEDVEFTAAESFEGEISSKKGTYVKVDGDKYYTAVAIAFDVEYTFYVDANGIIIEAVEIKDADKEDDRETEYVYVLDSQFKYEGGEDADLLNEAEEETLTYKVKYMTVDGDVVKADYAVFDKTIDKKTGETALYVEFLGKDVAAADLGAKHEDLEGWYEAAFEGDEIVLVKKVAVETKFAVSDAREWANGLRANSDTELVLLDEDGVYKTYTGRTNMPEMTLENAVVVTEKKTVVAIYNYAKEYEAEAVAPVVGMFKALGENVADGEIEATFVVAGSEETYVIAETELVKGGLYVVTEAADEDELTEVVALADSDIDYIEGTVDFVDGDYFEVGDADLEKAEDCAVYQFNKAGDKLSKGTLSTGKKVVVILDSEGDAAEIFQYKA